MSEVFLSGSTVDADVIRRVRKVLVQAGLTVWDPESSLSAQEEVQAVLQREIRHAQCVVVLWSAGAAQSHWVQWELSQAVSAWASNRLVLAVIDDTALPVGLRDLSPVNIQTTSDSGPQELVERVRAIVSHEAPLDSPTAVRTSAPLSPSLDRVERGARPLGRIILIIGTVIAALAVAILFALRRPAPSGGPPSGPSSPEQSDRVPFTLVVLTIGAMVGAGAVWVWRSLADRGSNLEQATVSMPPAPPTSSPQVFISYSRKDARIVEDLVRLMEGMGYPVWIDRASTGAQRYAAPIVRAIKMSNVVALMCSQNAFASDHVIREIYVAGDFKKPFIAFQLDPAELPDELRYFLSGFPRVATNIDPNKLQLEISRLVVSTPATSN